jgi:hypothetical protein
MNCLSLIRKRPAKGKIKRADNTMAIWTNVWNEKGQLPSKEESRSRALETQEDEHNVITGMPDTRMPMIISRMRCFLVIFISCGQLGRKCFETFSKGYPLYPHCGIKARVIYNFDDIFVHSLLSPVLSDL